MTEVICRVESWWNQRPVFCHLPDHRTGSFGYKGAHCGDVEGYDRHMRWWEWGNERRAYSWTDDCPLLARDRVLQAVRNDDIVWRQLGSRRIFRWYTSETEYRSLTDREREWLTTLETRGQIARVHALGYSNRGGFVIQQEAGRTVT